MSALASRGTGFFFDGIAVGEGSIKVVEIISHGLVEYPISNTEYRILIGGGHFGFDIPSWIFDIGYSMSSPHLRLQLLEPVLN